MIDYTKIQAGDKLRITGMGAPGFANIGDIVTVESTNNVNRCDVVNENGESAYFALTCGAQRLEPVAKEMLPLSHVVTTLRTRFDTHGNFGRSHIEALFNEIRILQERLEISQEACAKVVCERNALKDELRQLAAFAQPPLPSLKVGDRVELTFCDASKTDTRIRAIETVYRLSTNGHALEAPYAEHELRPYSGATKESAP